MAMTTGVRGQQEAKLRWRSRMVVCVLLSLSPGNLAPSGKEIEKLKGKPGTPSGKAFAAWTRRAEGRDLEATRGSSCRGFWGM